MNIRQADIDLIVKLETYAYSKSMNGVVPQEEQKEFRNVKAKLSTLSNLYKERYDSVAGIFKSETSSGNPISVKGKLRRVWSGIFKGSENKQYSAQISFVINAKDKCLDVGFYFGRASALNVNKSEEKKDRIEKWKKELIELGRLLYNEINAMEELRKSYYSLFDYGFKGEINNQRVTSDEWLQNLIKNPTHSSIVFNVSPDNNGDIEFSSVDLYVGMLLPLISVLPEQISINRSPHTRIVKSLTPEQWAKLAEKRTLIGLEGEKFIMKLEKEKLNSLQSIDKSYPIHKSLISDSFGYDILSKDASNKEIFIEVKTTAYMKKEAASKVFFISAREYKFYEDHEASYKLYRVFDIYGEPSYEEVNLKSIRKLIDGYRVELD